MMCTAWRFVSPLLAMGWLTDESPSPRSLSVHSNIANGCKSKNFYYFIKMMTQAPSFRNYLLSSHDHLRFLSCRVGGRWRSLRAGKTQLLGRLWHVRTWLGKPERRLSEMTGSEMQVSGGNWQEELATRARSRKAGNSGAGVWGEREGERKEHKMPMDHSWLLNLGLKPVSTRSLLKRSPPSPHHYHPSWRCGDCFVCLSLFLIFTATFSERCCCSLYFLPF